MTVATLKAALATIPDDARVMVWLPGSRIDVVGVTALTLNKDYVMLEGNLREGSALSA